ncbi:MAG: TIGR00725 family protein [bacterium]
MSARKIIGVIGAGQCSTEIAALAEEVGGVIAERNAILICGGLFGVMEAACRGARARGGMTIGILPGCHKSEANRYVDLAIPTGMSEARNIIIVRAADGVIAVGGKYGTLSEMAFCLKFGVPVVGLRTWQVSKEVVVAKTAEEAVSRIFELIGRQGSEYLC